MRVDGNGIKTVSHICNLQLDEFNDNININSIVELEKYVKMKRKEILSKHKGKIYQISTGRFEGYWQTTAKHEQTNRTLILRAKDRNQLDEKIIQFYSSTDTHTIDECYQGWIKYLSINKKASSIHTYEKVQKRNFMPIKDTSIETLTPFQIKLFVKKAVAESDLTSKGYAMLKTNLLGIFHYAKDVYGYDVNIDNIVQELTRELRGSFKRSAKSQKKDSELLFSKDEENKLIDYIDMSNKLVDLGIKLLFMTGLRVGELSALKKCDIASDYKSIHICRTEERVSNKADYIVVDTAKTQAGDREVVLTQEATMLLKAITEKSNIDSEYIFSDSKYDRYPAKKFRDRLYRLCTINNLDKRGPHAIRRTYASKLARAGIPEWVIIKQMGHTDISVTKQFYIYNTQSKDELIEELGKV